MQILSSVAINGIRATEVQVEVDVSPGMGQFSIVGLGDTAVQESRERVRSAIKNSGYAFPGGARITVNLAPADIKKKGPLYDLPIALGILGREQSYDRELIDTSIFLGELALDGSVRSVSGVISAVVLAKNLGKRSVFLPESQLREASLIPEITPIPVRNLQEAVDILTKKRPLPPHTITTRAVPRSTHGVDFSDIHGQEHAKRALIIAAAGGHNLLMQGPPGSGKTLLAKSIVSLLPPLELDEQIEISQIYSVAGLLSPDTPLITERPFRSVHHTASEASIIGGGRDARPGEISLAHKGVLFLDEFLEFPKHLLETLRQPLEDGYITVNRVSQSAEYPARFSLIGAMNPCPCGYMGDPEKACTCPPHAIDRYRSRISGPILDRIDMYITVPRIRISEMNTPLNTSPSSTEPSTHSPINSITAQEMVLSARKQQKQRFKDSTAFCNAEMSHTEIERIGKIHSDAKDITIHSVERLKLSTRSYYRILRVARTIADLEGTEYVETPHILEALSYRIHS